MKRSKFLQWMSFLIFFGSTILLMMCSCRTQVTDAEPTFAQFVLIENITLGENDLEHPRGALLITAEDEIQQINHWLASGISSNHACCPNIGVTFWSDRYNVETEYDINDGLDRYNRKLKPYFQELLEQPTHYVYDLKIPVQILPEIVIRDFSAQNLLVFSYLGKNPQLPSIIIRKEYYAAEGAEWLSQNETEMETDLNAQIEIITALYPVQSVSEVSCNYIRRGGKDGCVAKVSVKFHPDADLTNIDEMILDAAEIWEIKTPKFFYLQLVIAERDLAQVKHLVNEQFEYVVDVFRFPDGIDEY